MRFATQALSGLLPQLILTLLLGACTTPAPGPALRSLQPRAPSRGTPIGLFVARRGWHIDVGFAVDDLLEPLQALRSQFADAHYLSFGFGDRRYLRQGGRRVPNMLAALWPGDGLVLLTALANTPQQAFGDSQVVTLWLSRSQALAAQRAIAATLQPRDQQFLSDGPGPYAGSLFLRSSARYSALHTCNTWAAEILRAAGLPVRSRGVVFAGQLWRQLRRIAAPGDAVTLAITPEG